MNKLRTLCRESSVESNEAMFGTATNAGLWCLIEYRGNFTGKALNDSKIPPAVKNHLNKELKKMSGSRLQLIKKHKNKEEELRLFLALSDEANPKLYEIKFKEYAELLDLNVKKILKSDKHLSKEKIYIICTNGEYDTCCGKFGMPVYLDVAKSEHGERTWESNHIGGHRFAATFACLPEGIVYGHVQNGKEAQELIKLHESGEMELESLRGRSCYSNEVQAGEYFVRKQSGLTGIHDFALKNSKKNDKKISVKFISQEDNKTHTVKIAKEKKAVEIIKSCGDGRSTIDQFILLDYKEK